MDLSLLSQDGDTLDLQDGRKLRLKIEPDQFYNPFEDTDIYGKIGWDRTNQDTGRAMRPAGFDGNAERIDILNDRLWWQPPADVKRGTPEFGRLRSLVINLASYGGQVVTLEVLKGRDAYRRPIVRQTASVGGIDSLEDGYLGEVVGELAAELNIEEKKQ